MNSLLNLYWFEFAGKVYLAMNYNNSLNLEWAAEVGLQRKLMNSTGVPVRTSLVSGGVHLLGVGRKQDERLKQQLHFRQYQI